MTVYLLNEEPIFPPPSEAEPDGLIALGGDLSPLRLLNAYAEGIFPWFRDEEDVFWFSPDPRMLLFPHDLKISASLKRVIRSGKFEVRCDTVFRDVIEGCASAFRQDQDGTWIDREFIDAYSELHRLGYAHSFETFTHGELCGGLYGVSVGRAFFGESMFHKTTDASKVAFCAMVEKIKTWQFDFVDCQVETDLVKRFGAKPVPRGDYLERLKKAISPPSLKGKWVL